MNPWFTEVVEAHVAIEAWLGRGTGSLEALIARFSPQFTMITPNGAAIDYEALTALFTTQRAARDGLRIDIDSMTLIQAWDDGAVVRYRERQSVPGNDATARWSTAVFTLENQQPVWLSLHETLIP